MSPPMKRTELPGRIRPVAIDSRLLRLLHALSEAGGAIARPVEDRCTRAALALSLAIALSAFASVTGTGSGFRLAAPAITFIVAFPLALALWLFEEVPPRARGLTFFGAIALGGIGGFELGSEGALAVSIGYFGPALALWWARGELR